MDAMLTLYILAGCVALAALLFIVMGIASLLRPPRLPDLASLTTTTPPLSPLAFARALTPRPLPQAAAIIALQPMPARSMAAANDRSAPRTVIPLPAIAGIAPATRAQSSPGAGSAAHLATHATPAAPMSPHVPSMSTPAAPMSRPIAADPAPRSFALPIPAPRPTPMPVSTTRIPVTLPTLTAPPALPARMPRATMQPIAPAPPAPPAPMPRVTMPPVKSIGDWTTEPDVAVVRRSDTTMPIFRQRPSLLRTVIGWTIATLLVAASPAVVEPSLLDPLCDDYEWEGAEAAAIARAYALESNVAIDLDPFAITKVDSNVRPFP